MPSQEERAQRWTELARLPKHTLTRMCAEGIPTPHGRVIIEGGAVPVPRWPKDEIVNSIVDAQFPLEEDQ